MDILTLFLKEIFVRIAYQYLISGYFEGTITWEKGETTANENVMKQINKSLGI